MTNVPATTATHSLIHRALHIAYCTQNPANRSHHLAIAALLEALAAQDPEGTEELVDSLRATLIHPDEALQRAVSRGIDVSEWPADRAATERTELWGDVREQPIRVARRMWQGLIEWQAPAAHALATILRDLPEDWEQLLFPAGVPAAKGGTVVAEVAPWEEDVEECSACGEVEDNFCRYHQGWAGGTEAEQATASSPAEVA